MIFSRSAVRLPVLSPKAASSAVYCDHLGFGVGLGLFCLGAARVSFRVTAACWRGDLGLDVAGRLLVLGGGFRQALQFQLGADVLGGGVHALALGTRQLGT